MLMLFADEKSCRDAASDRETRLHHPLAVIERPGDGERPHVVPQHDLRPRADTRFFG
jgi:hypothetical protein